MKFKKEKLSFIAILSLVLSAGVSAGLIDRGNGMIYDSDQNITWLQDANYAKTSGYDTDGRMSWDAAMDWADNLEFGGYNDWRLPTITDEGNDGCQFAFVGTDCGYNVDTSGSELAYMWYENLGSTPAFDTSGNENQGLGLTSTSADGVEILNLQRHFYWSGTVSGYNPTDLAWYFYPYAGFQSHTAKIYEFYALAVRSGDVVNDNDVTPVEVPEPGTLLLMFAGLASLVGARRKRG